MTAPESTPPPRQGNHSPTDLVAPVTLLCSEHEAEISGMWTVVDVATTALEEALRRFSKGREKKWAIRVKNTILETIKETVSDKEVYPEERTPNNRSATPRRDKAPTQSPQPAIRLYGFSRILSLLLWLLPQRLARLLVRLWCYLA